MQEYYELVQKGFRILVSPMSGFIGKELNRVYKTNWWNEVLRILNDQRDLPDSGSYDEVLDSLDIANCIRLIDRQWNDVFRNVLTPICRTWAKELMAVRNIVSHLGQQDLEQPMAERALDTMTLLCEKIDEKSAVEIREIYKEVRARADNNSIKKVFVPFVGLAQPKSDSVRGELKEGSLLKLVGNDIVQKTTLTRKVTYAGKTVVYPVYRVRLDAIFYNDQNDRIATWITRYESENGKDALNGLNIEIYNRIIENFIVESNPEAITKTQKNILIVGQREPGVTLADGRIVDGNRRYTCLRRIQRDNPEPLYFETVIMDMDIREDKKQIKLLELAIQHGEEKKVDYDMIDYAVGTYRDVVQTKLLTVEEYAQSTNESVADVRKRIEIADVICEFLNYLKLPEQYHVAREMQVYSLFQEMMSSLRNLDDNGKHQLKIIAFNNAMMHAMPDQRKFIRDIKSLIKNGTYETFFEEQQKLADVIKNELDRADIHTKEDIDRFAEQHGYITEKLQRSMETALYKSRSQVLKNKPTENIAKCISLLTEVDSRLFSKLDEYEKEKIQEDLKELEVIVKRFQNMIYR